MAKIVDHEQRRSDIVEVTAHIIASEGLEAVTTRRIAKESNCSLGILSHYFANKDEIVIGALNWCDTRFEARLSELYSEEFLSLDDFSPLFLALLPLDELSETEWRVRTNLITYSLTHAELKLLRREKLRYSYDVAAKFVEKLQNENEIRTDIDASTLAVLAVDVAFGLCINLLSFDMDQRHGQIDKMFSLLGAALKPDPRMSFNNEAKVCEITAKPNAELTIDVVDKSAGQV